VGEHRVNGLYDVDGVPKVMIGIPLVIGHFKVVHQTLETLFRVHNAEVCQLLSETRGILEIDGEQYMKRAANLKRGERIGVKRPCVENAEELEAGSRGRRFRNHRRQVNLSDWRRGGTRARSRRTRLG
jgi:hypothetical protein